jgi:hypothetical protein
MIKTNCYSKLNGLSFWPSFTVRTIVPFLLGALLNMSTACIKAIRHDEDLAATSAVVFARDALVHRDYLGAYRLLTPNSQKESGVKELKDSIVQMHPKNWPTSITAIEYEPLPGREAMTIYLYAREANEDFIYSILMEGNADIGYRVSRISRLQTPLPSPSRRRPLQIRRTSD